MDNFLKRETYRKSHEPVFAFDKRIVMRICEDRLRRVEVHRGIVTMREDSFLLVFVFFPSFVDFLLGQTLFRLVLQKWVVLVELQDPIFRLFVRDYFLQQVVFRKSETFSLSFGLWNELVKIFQLISGIMTVDLLFVNDSEAKWRLNLKRWL